MYCKYIILFNNNTVPDSYHIMFKMYAIYPYFIYKVYNLYIYTYIYDQLAKRRMFI